MWNSLNNFHTNISCFHIHCKFSMRRVSFNRGMIMVIGEWNKQPYTWKTLVDDA